MQPAPTAIPFLQAYLRYSAQQQYEAVAVPPFTLFFHSTDALRFFNYAIPDAPIIGDVQAALGTLKTIFRERQRQPRFEFIQEYAPALIPALSQAGFAEEGRYPMMLCTPETARPVPVVAGLTITWLAPGAAPADVHAFILTQRLGFEPTNPDRVTDQAVAALCNRLDKNFYFLARLDGQPASAGVFTLPYNGVTELAGIATREAFRRRGIASALTAHLARAAFARGVTIACLSAADERAGRMYERVGFRTLATMLAYSVPA